MLCSNSYNYCVWFWSNISFMVKKIRDFMRVVIIVVWFLDYDLNWGLKDLSLLFIFCKCFGVFSRFFLYYNVYTYYDCLMVKCCSYLGF